MYGPSSDPQVGSDDESIDEYIYETLETTFENNKVNFDSNVLNIIPPPSKPIAETSRNVQFSNTSQTKQKPPPLMSLNVAPTDALLKLYQQRSRRLNPFAFFKGPPLQGWGVITKKRANGKNRYQQRRGRHFWVKNKKPYISNVVENKVKEKAKVENRDQERQIYLNFEKSGKLF